MASRRVGVDDGLGPPSSDGSQELTIGIVAPPWVAIPPPAYGGIELMIDCLARGLVGLGHRVKLFTLGTSTCPVERLSLFDEPPEQIGGGLVELRHALAAYDHLAGRCDIIHDHTLAGVVIAAAGEAQGPVVTTNHGPFNDELIDIYRRVVRRVPVIAISADQASRAPRCVPLEGVIHHGIDVEQYRPRLRRSSNDGYVLSLARMHPDKGIDLAIEVARRAGKRLVIAAKMREPAERTYFAEVIAPLLGGDVAYVGEVDDGRKKELLAGADALLNTIQWPEPFGLTMIEALACGTPVVATPNGAADEIVTSGVNGYLASSVDDLALALCQLDQIDRRRCRRDATQRFSMRSMATEHVDLYRQVIRRRQDEEQREAVARG